MALKFGLQEWRNYHPRDDATAPIVLCFGDSWFWYPIPGVGNLANRFLDFGQPLGLDIVAIGRTGLEIIDPGKQILADLTTFLQWEAHAIDLILVSGGGNDFAGPDDLDPLMKKGNKRNPDDIGGGYDRVRYLRDTYCPQVPIVTHCYDYAHATGQGLLWFSPWIKPSFDKVGVPKRFRHRLVKQIIDRIAKVHKRREDALYHFVDTRKTLKRRHWANELHPTANGFNRIAEHFYPVFEQRFPNRVTPPHWMD